MNNLTNNLYLATISFELTFMIYEQLFSGNNMVFPVMATLITFYALNSKVN